MVVGLWAVDVVDTDQRSLGGYVGSELSVDGFGYVGWFVGGVVIAWGSGDF